MVIRVPESHCIWRPSICIALNMQSLGVTGKELENERRDVVIVRMGVCLSLDTRTTHPSPLPVWSVALVKLVGCRELPAAHPAPVGTLLSCLLLFCSAIDSPPKHHPNPTSSIAPSRPFQSLMLRTSIRSVRALGSRPVAAAAGRQWQATAAQRVAISAQV